MMSCGLGAGAIDESLADYNRILELDPGNIDALYYRGTILEKVGEVDGAICDFTDVLELDPDHIKASYARGACQNLKGEFSRAIGKL